MTSLQLVHAAASLSVCVITESVGIFLWGGGVSCPQVLGNGGGGVRPGWFTCLLSLSTFMASGKKNVFQVSRSSALHNHHE